MEIDVEVFDNVAIMSIVLEIVHPVLRTKAWKPATVKALASATNEIKEEMISNPTRKAFVAVVMQV
jgi:hypothetical protein